MSSKHPSSLNVFMYDGKLNVVAGFYQHGKVSVEEFYRWMGDIVHADAPWALFPCSPNGDITGLALQAEGNTSILEPGEYAIRASDGSVIPLWLTSDTHRPRTLSLNPSGPPRAAAFCARLRARDQPCCITGAKAYPRHYHHLKATHIFPGAHVDIWARENFQRFIQDDAPEHEQGTTKTNSIQNGLLFRSDVHDLFDAYEFGIDPDDNYRVVGFTPPTDSLDGQHMWVSTDVAERYRPSRDILCEHFRQCILANVKGAGRQGLDDEAWDQEVRYRSAEYRAMVTWNRSGAPRTGDEGSPGRFRLKAVAEQVPMEI